MRSTINNVKRTIALVLFIAVAEVIFAGIQNISKPVQAQNSCILGDANGDGKVTLTDFEVWRRIFIGGSPDNPTPTNTPAPSGGISYVPISQAKYVVAPNGDDSNPGTESQPFRTIQKAADVAGAGDVVVIRSGSYNEFVHVKNTGTQNAPLVFQSETKGAAIITGQETGFIPNDWQGDNTANQTVNAWVTLRGITFQDITGDTHYPIRATEGWNIEDCFFNRVPFGVYISGDFVVVHDTIFDDVNSTGEHALVGAGTENGRRMKGVHIYNVQLRNLNRLKQNKAMDNSGNVKFLSSDGLIVENVLSEDNNGPGFWLDWDNVNFIIRNNMFRNNKGAVQDWEGMGLLLEGNKDSNGQVYNNTFSGNSGDGLAIAETNRLSVHNNVFLNNSNCIDLRNLNRGDDQRYLRDLTITDNLCGGSTQTFILATLGEGYTPGWTYAGHNIVIDNNHYVTGSTVPFVDMSSLGIVTNTLQETQQKLNIELHGEMVPPTYQLPQSALK